jgi:Xaa-Pro aminopeptidase
MMRRSGDRFSEPFSQHAVPRDAATGVNHSMNDTLLPGKRENPAGLPFSSEEFQVRRERACELLRQQRIDLAVISSPVNFYYLTGMYTGVSHYIFVLALRPNGDGLWIVRRTEMSNVSASAPYSWVKEGIPVDDSEDPPLKLAEIVGKLVGPTATVGLEFSSPQVSVAAYIKLQAAAPQMRFVDISGAVESLRVIKSQAELAYMRRAGTICGTAMQEALENLRPGARDSDLATDLIGRAIRLGSEPMAMGPFVTCGLRSFRAHSSWVHEPIGRGRSLQHARISGCRPRKTQRGAGCLSRCFAGGTASGS